MFTPLGIKTDYSILCSLIKINDLISFSKQNGLKCLGILDNNMTSSYCFYQECIKNNIKPIIGFHLIINDVNIYLYAKGNKGLKNLFKLNKICEELSSFDDLSSYNEDIIAVLPYSSINYYEEIKKIFDCVFISYKNKEEESKLSDIENKVFINIYNNLSIADAKYVNYLNLISKNASLGSLEFVDYTKNTLKVLDYDTTNFTDLIGDYFTNIKKHLPKYFEDKNSYEYMTLLANKGLRKRLNGNITSSYQNRLDYELKVIEELNFTDYFLIVFDYVRFALKNDIYVGPGRGSAAGSLVAYSLGITSIDPIKYNLMFERFLNPKRVTMPDIDIDFQDTRRDEVIDYVKNKYGSDKVSKIITFSKMTTREVIRVVAKINNCEEYILNNLLKHLDSKKDLRSNLTEYVKSVLKKYPILNKIYEEAIHLEGIKRHIGIHAAGIVISCDDLCDVVPVVKYNGEYLTGYTMEELEPLGLLKMDFLSLQNLTLISNTLKSIKEAEKVDINLNQIDLNIKEVYDLFKYGDTTGIFQFEAPGMKSFLIKSKPSTFDDLVMAIAIYRPGPMDQIPEYLNRKNNHKKIDYIDKSLESILSSTYGIMIYQEQIMEILKQMGSFELSEADIIRRAISKKKHDVILSYREKFIKNATHNGYSLEVSNKVFDLITKFASFGFNKSHSVSYALIAYQMAYLKTFYKKYFITNLLNINIASEKSIQYIKEATSSGIKIKKCDINKSMDKYIEESDGIRIPFSAIKGFNTSSVSTILSKRGNGYVDFFDFVSKMYGTNVNKKSIDILIEAGVFDSFNINKKTLKKNLDAAYLYAELVSNLDESLVNKPVIELADEFSDLELMNMEKDLYGYYISTHPCNKYPSNFKLINIKDYFDKVVKCVLLVEDIKKIKTKTGENMAFISVSDETSKTSLVVFKNNYDKLSEIETGILVEVKGKVEKRLSNYSIVVIDISKK